MWIFPHKMNKSSNKGALFDFQDHLEKQKGILDKLITLRFAMFNAVLF